MSLYREPKKPQLPWQDLAVFAAVLAFLGYSIHAFLGLHRPNRPAEVPVKEALAPLPAPGRKIASQSNPAPGSGSTEILRAPCLPSAGPLRFHSQARLLQIHASLCESNSAGNGAWKASNESSGEEILVFVNRKEKTISTSYFSLKDGTNQIVFTGTGAPSEKSGKIQIIKKAD